MKLAGAVVAEAVERQKDKQELRQVIAGTAEKLEGLVSDEALLREKKDAELVDEIASNAKHDALKDDCLQEQTNQNAQAKADKQHEDTRQQTEKEYQTNQINDLANGVLGVILYVYRALGMLLLSNKTHRENTYRCCSERSQVSRKPEQNQKLLLEKNHH